MKFIERDIANKVREYTGLFPVVFLTGPRQSGKSTLLRNAFPSYRYVNLEEPDMREAALSDPRGFLLDIGYQAIIDEAQYAPELFSYIQSSVDERDEAGAFILSGSQNFIMLRSITQSLAGRVGILSLLPFSESELERAGETVEDTDEWLYKGQYPRLIQRGICPRDFYPSYMKTYVERDVALESGVRNVDSFTAFMRICALNVGSPLNLASIASAAAIDTRTAMYWLNILEESYISFRLKPYANKVTPRYAKKPKLYFYDTGLLCSLLGIATAEDLNFHKMRGQIFENAVLTEYYKSVYNKGGFPNDNAYFWRDSSNREREVDLVVEQADHLDLYEIKSSRTANAKYAHNLLLLERNVAGIPCSKTVIYDGPHDLTVNGVKYLNRRGKIRQSVFP